MSSTNRSPHLYEKRLKKNTAIKIENNYNAHVKYTCLDMLLHWVDARNQQQIGVGEAKPPAGLQNFALLFESDHFFKKNVKILIIPADLDPIITFSTEFSWTC